MPGPEPALPPPVTVVDALPSLVFVGVVPLLVVTLTVVDMLPLGLAVVDMAVVTGVVEAVPGMH